MADNKGGGDAGMMKGIENSVSGGLGCLVLILLLFFGGCTLIYSTAGLSASNASKPIAQFVGITASTVKGPSAQLFVDIWNETGSALGIPNAPATDEQNASTNAGGGTGGTAAQQPAAAPAPSFIKSSQLSEQALLAWRGVDSNSTLLKTGADLGEVQRLVTAALDDNPKDLLALWLQKKLTSCSSLITKLQAGLTPQTAAEIQAAATDLVKTCNPRILVAHAIYRWAALVALPAGGDINPQLLSGLNIAVLKKVDGPARGLRDTDHIKIVIKEVSGAGWKLTALNFKITVSQLNELLGKGALDANGGGAWWPEMGDVKVPGVFLPDNPPEPIVPTEDQLAVPTAVAPPPVSTTSSTVVEGTGGGGESRTYVVKQGEWATKIARDHNVTLEQLQAANPGVDLTQLQVDQILNLP